MATKRTSADIHNESSESSSDPELSESPEKAIALSDSFTQSSSRGSGSSSSSSKMRSYKDNLSYDPKWKIKYPWMDYNSASNGIVCTVCTVDRNPPI